MYMLRRYIKGCCVFMLFFIATDSNYLFGVQYNSHTDKRYALNIINDGPIPLDIPITFQVQLLNSNANETFLYNFEDNVDPPHKFQVRGNNTISSSLLYPEDVYKPGYYVMVVTCYTVYLEAIHMKIATGNVSFSLTQYISGTLDLMGVNEKYDKLYATTGTIVNMSISLGLPHHVIKSSELSYSWNINRDKFITSRPFNSYLFQEPGTYNIHVTAVARIPNYDADDGNRYKWGYFNKELDAKAPLTAINLTGNTYLKHGQLFNVEVSCTGSGPFEYCWKVVPPLENLTCLSPVVTTHCSFPIIYYFNPSGDYRVAISIDNFVSSLQRKIDVHIYDVSLSPQLSTVIIPLFCSVLVIFIIAGGVMLHVRRNQQFDIETADFDFMQSDACVVETFWERLYHSILSIFRRHRPKTYLHLTYGEEQVTSSTSYSSTDP